MFIKATRVYIKNLLAISLLFIICVNKVIAQDVPLATTNGVYTYLDQMSMSYPIQWQDLVKPVSRRQIANALHSLQQQSAKLSKAEIAELYFYMQEFGISNKAQNKNALNNGDTTHFFKKDPQGRWRTFYYKEKNNTIHLDPIIGGSIGAYKNEMVVERNAGVTMWGSIENKVDYLLSFNDISLNGAGIKNMPSFSAVPKYVNIGASESVNSKNYNELRASVSYRFKNGFVSAGQDRFSYGYGQDAQIVLSQNVPAYPYVKLQYQPFKWLQFNYMHAWLQSNIIDSSASYNYGNNTYGGYHQQYQPKYYATHSFNFIIKPGVEINLGESIVYTNSLNAAYLIPVMYFKSYDNTSNNQNILAGDNGQLFVGFNIRRWIPKTQLYGQLFIDEIRLSEIFSKQNRNQLGYQLGIKKSGWLPKDHLVMGVEYTRNRPFIYSNINPVLNYTHHGQNLGDWMGNNADRFLLYAQYKLMERMYAKISYEKIRKGGPGTTDDQYLKSPQPAFLFNPLFNQKNINFEIRYQWLHNVNLQLQTNFTTINNPNSSEAIKSNNLQIGMYMGLY
jgi:hypothetical protein